MILNKRVAAEFSSSDLRRQNWIREFITGTQTYYYPFKYKLNYTGSVPAEYTVVFRLSEQYLIRSEANAHLDNLNAALDDLNVIRNRAGLVDTLLSTSARNAWGYLSGKTT